MIESIKPTDILSKYIKDYFIVETDNSEDYLPNERVHYATEKMTKGIKVKYQKTKK